MGQIMDGARLTQLSDQGLHLGKFHHDLTVLPNPGKSWLVREMISKWPQFRCQRGVGRDRKKLVASIQVSEIIIIIYPDYIPSGKRLHNYGKSSANFSWDNSGTQWWIFP